MRATWIRTCVPTISLVLLAAPAVRANGARIVNAPGLPPFTDLQAAVDASSEGDTILVAGGQYEGFTIDDKSLSVVAVPGQAVFVAGAIQVLHLPVDKRVLLSGIAATGRVLTGLSEPALIVTDCQGNVRIETCNLTGGLGSLSISSQKFGDGGHAVVLQASTQVVFAHCTITGGKGGGTSSQCESCTGGTGGHGVRINLSQPTFYQCTVTGGAGATALYHGGKGGAGAWQGNSWLFAAGSSFKGGRGGNGEDFLPAYGGDGGDGLFVNTGATADLLDNTYAGGLGGNGNTGVPANKGQPGSPMSGGGTFNQYPGKARALAASLMQFDGADLQVAVSGEPGDSVWLRISQRPAYRFQASLPGVHAVHSTQVPLVAAGLIPPSGQLQLLVALPNSSVQPEQVLYVQGFGFDAAGAAWLGTPMQALVLDREAPPDCNGNQQSDLADTVLGSSGDCGPNLVPDECEPDCDANGLPDACDIQVGTHMDCNENGVPDVCDIAAGASLDCNVNGVPDECDLASGTSPDANGNGIPDECDPNVVWWVDDSAPPGGNGSSATPFQTIAEAMSPAIDGDEIVLRDGVYSGPGNREVAFGGRSVVLRSENGPASCMIDLQGLGRAFSVDEAVGAGARIEGLTFNNGNHASGKAGAIYVRKAPIVIRGCVFASCQVTPLGSPGNELARGGAIYLDASPARMEDCTFIANSVGATSQSAGGAIYSTANYFEQPDPLRILRCTFIGNSASYGGAVDVNFQVLLQLSHCRFISNMAFHRGGGLAARMAAYSGGPTSKIGDCLFAGNTAADHGGGVVVSAPCCTNESYVWLRDSTFVGNQAGTSGGGLAVLHGSTFVRIGNCIAWDNQAPSGPQVALNKLQGGANPTLLVESSDVKGGPTAVFVSSGSLTWGVGNLDLDPQFLDADGPDNNPSTFEDNDYRPIAGAPGNDAGSNLLVLPDLTDIDGDGNTAEPTPLDLDLTLRFVEDLLAPNVGAGTPPLVDMGCYER
jgi:hypothetical protein